MPRFHRAPPHQYRIATEKTRILKLFTKREVPKSTPGRLLLTSWNIANLGNQKRTPGALEVIAHILKRFDLIAVQEVNDNFRTFVEVMSHLGSGFDFVMSDTAGNNERLAYVYRKARARPTNLFGELALLPRSYPKRTVKVRWTDANKVDQVQTFRDFRFEPFDRNPFIGSFQSDAIDFTLVNVHLYFGKFQNSKSEADRRKYARRVLEIHALARWAAGRVSKSSTFDPDIILLGDMNVPSMDPKESTYRELVRYGFQPVQWVSKTGGSNLGNDKTYDQMTFAPGSLGNRIEDIGVFDFDNAIFKDLWARLNGEFSKRKAIGKFNSHVKYHVSDHRPLWVQLDTT